MLYGYFALIFCIEKVASAVNLRRRGSKKNQIPLYQHEISRIERLRIQYHVHLIQSQENEKL